MKKMILCIVFFLIGCAFPLIQRDNAEIQKNFELAKAQSDQIIEDAYARRRQMNDPQYWGKVRLVWVREDLKTVYLYLNKDGVYYSIALPMDDEYGLLPYKGERK